MRFKILPIAALLLFGASGVKAQVVNDSTELLDPGVMYVDPLFEYPVAPEELSEFRDKCDWLVTNFWNPLDVKNKQAVDQAKLNHAFQVYATTAQFADKAKVTAGIDKVMKSLQKNPMLLFQFTKAAEECIYGPRAEIWIDELYLRILDSALANKKFPASRRARYELQQKQLTNSMIGNPPPSFVFTRPNGEEAKYFTMSTPTIIIFGDPDCDDCRIAKLRMQSNVSFSKAVADGKVNVLFILPDPDEGWKDRFKDFPKGWTVGASESVSDLFDIREIPEVYVVDSEGKIAAKHISIIQSMLTALDLINK